MVALFPSVDIPNEPWVITSSSIVTFANGIISF